MADKSQVVDNNTLIRHEVPNCISRELYKYVVDEQAVGAFAGRVYVAEGAQKTVSEEVNQNICASSDARMYTQPMLEIYADDVKCSHGSTVGKLDEMALFYMRQRGIPLAEARMLLMQAFVGQVIDEIPIVPLRDRLHIMIEQRLKGELDKCVGCARCK
jgi:Fe-S cluster assembly protein SufD